jgi:hypothetical protein
MSEENVALARKAIDALNRADFDALLAVTKPPRVYRVAKRWTSARGGLRSLEDQHQEDQNQQHSNDRVNHRGHRLPGMLHFYPALGW